MSGETIRSPLSEVPGMIPVKQNSPDDKRVFSRKKRKKKKKERKNSSASKGGVEDLMDHTLENLLEDDGPLVLAEDSRETEEPPQLDLLL
ncbi:MAG: hypothetical protein K8S55_04135 [Phycisphaerae bacterium]|nr:hypothetical protein [Phycisphaerae bacterium]